jgi:hypothetical protein
MYSRPMYCFKPQTPYKLHTIFSVSASRGKGRSCFFLNFWWDLTESALTPRTTIPACW